MLKKLKLWDETIEPAIRIGAKVDLDAMRQRAIRDIEKKGGFVMKEASNRAPLAEEAERGLRR